MGNFTGNTILYTLNYQLYIIIIAYIQIPSSPPYFQGLLSKVGPFFMGGALAMGDLMGDCLYATCHF